MPDPTPAEVLTAFQLLVDTYSTMMVQRLDIDTGSATGGPAGDGFYPFTLSNGVTISYPSLAKVLAIAASGGGGGGGVDTFDPGSSGLISTTEPAAILEVWSRASLFLNNLTLQGGTFPTNTPQDALIGTLAGWTEKSTKVLDPTDSRVYLAGGDISGWKLYRGAGAVTAGTNFTVTVKETDQRARNKNGSATGQRVSTLTFKPVTPPAFSTISGFGNSITYGQNASSEANRWLNLVAANFGITGANVRNKGIQGTILQNNAMASGAAQANNGRDRYGADLLGSNKSGRVYLCYGYNDARYIAAPSTCNAAGFENDLTEVVLGLIAGGYKPTDIVLMTPAYITDTGLTTGSTGFAGQTRAGFEAYVAKVLIVAQALGTQYANVYAAMRDGGGASLISGDNIHPNDAGHAKMAETALAASVVNPLPGCTALTVSSSGAGLLSASWTAPSYSVGVDHYEVGYFPSENVARTGIAGVAAGTTTKAWTGVAGGTMFAYVRPQYTDGTAGPIVVSSNSAYITPPAIQFLLDTFTGSDGTTILSHVGETGASWTTATGYSPSPDSAIASNRLYCPSGVGVYYANGVPNKADYDVAAVMDCITSSSSDTCGIMARYDPSTIYYWADYRAGTGWRLFKQIGTTITSLGTKTASFAAGSSKTVTLHVRSAAANRTIDGATKLCNIWMDVDGVALIGVEDYSITGAGKAGIRMASGQTSTTGIQITSISATTT